MKEKYTMKTIYSWKPIKTLEKIKTENFLDWSLRSKTNAFEYKFFVWNSGKASFIHNFTSGSTRCSKVTSLNMCPLKCLASTERIKIKTAVISSLSVCSPVCTAVERHWRKNNTEMQRHVPHICISTYHLENALYVVKLYVPFFSLFVELCFFF